jgi:hypothetical protein
MTAPESSPKPAAAAIAEGRWQCPQCACEEVHHTSHGDGIICKSCYKFAPYVWETGRTAAAINLGKPESAIQRGDGQTTKEFVERNEFNSEQEKLRNPPADERCAKPNETSGATPEQKEQKAFDDWISYEAHLKELAAVRAAGDHIGDANEMVSAVRKSAGAEGAENEKPNSNEVRLVLMVAPDGSYHAIGGDVEPSYEGAESTFLGLERMKKSTAAKSTPGVLDAAVEALEYAKQVAEHFVWPSDAAKYESAIAQLRAKRDADGASGGKETV